MLEAFAQTMREPPFYSRLLFEDPWPVVVGLVIVWAVVRITGRRMEKKALLHGSWAALALAGMAIGVSMMVDTPREKLAVSLRELMLSIEQGDVEKFKQIVPEDASAQYLGMELKRRQIDDRLDEVNIEDLTLLDHESGLINDQNAVSIIRVRIAGGAGFLDITNWSITWQWRDDQWQAVRFEYLGRPDNLLGE